MSAEAVQALIIEWGSVVLALISLIATAVSAIRKIKKSDSETSAELKVIRKQQIDLNEQMKSVLKENAELKHELREAKLKGFYKPVTIPKDGKK